MTPTANARQFESAACRTMSQPVDTTDSGNAALAAARARRPLILHITGDYPDPVREPTTEAVARLIDGLDSYDHIVVSLKRLANPAAGYFTECPAKPGQRLFAYGHFGLPFGVGLFPSFWLVARRIEALLADLGVEPDIVHSHRLTFDGLAGWLISRRRRIPHFLSVRGEVESKVLRYKPTYRPLLRRIVADASRIYYVSAWYEPMLQRQAGADPAKGRVLPNLVSNVRETIAPRDPEPAFVTALNLDIYRKKGLDRLLAAFALAGKELDGVRLDVFGSGKAEAEAEVRAIVDRLKLGGRVRFMGRVANAAFLEVLPRYLAMALPGRNETFGMVYTEALFAGVPILYSTRTGIDGYLDGLEVGIGADSEDIPAISRGLVSLYRENHSFRQRVAASGSELYWRFEPNRQLQLYRDDVERAIGKFSDKD